MGRIIAIDGPSGAGKSTVGKLLAQRLGFMYIDTGAMYRTAALLALEAGIDVNEGEKVARLCESLDFSFEVEGTRVRVVCNGRDVTEAIRTHEMGMYASDVSKQPAVRTALLKLQRELGEKHDAILDGRDIGTVVFPQADIKFFLDASLEERARRRYRELVEKGESVSYEEVKATMERRDHNDSTRRIAPLRPADDAIRVDTTGKSIPEVLESLMRSIEAREIV